jgi:hypothetical protein
MSGRILEGCDVLPPMDTEKPVPRKKTPGKAADRFAVLNQFVDRSMVSLQLTDVAVWLVLYRDTRKGLARTAQTDIARRAGIGTRTVPRSLKRLRAAGLLEVIHQGGLNRGISVDRVFGLSKGH